jgi:outer membrane immunogenic protein
MQKTLVAAAFAAGLGIGGAYAADLNGGLKDAPTYATAGSWTGFYLGVGLGGGSIIDDGKASVVYDDTPISAELNGLGAQGMFGTVQVGYDRQFGRFVGGVFFDYDFTNIKGTLSAGLDGIGVNLDAGLNDEWSAGGRAGYLVNSETLVYGLGAYTQGKFFMPLNLPGTTRDGYTVGGGIETRLTGNWFLKGEYRFTHFDEVELFNSTLLGMSAKLSDQPDLHTARLVVSYKADFFGPSLAPLK